MTASVAETQYPNFREVLDPRFATLSDADLESLFESAFGEGITPAEYEEFFGGLGNAFKNALPMLASGAQGALQGAMAGSALGPFGMLGGALAGGVGSALQKHGGGAARGVGNILSGVVGTAGALSGAGGLARGATGLLGLAGRTAGGYPPAASHLLGLLNRPETMRALTSLQQGRNAPVPVGATGTPVPANAFAGLLGALAREAEAEATIWDAAESVPAYLANPAGELVVDAGDPDQRAARLLQLLAGEAYEEASEPAEAYDDAAEFEEFEEFEEWYESDLEYEEDFPEFDERYQRIGA
jgi:hypothetical protein